MTHFQTQDDEALIEAMARAMYGKPSSWMWIGDTIRQAYRTKARAALTALRNHEGRKG